MRNWCRSESAARHCMLCRARETKSSRTNSRYILKQEKPMRVTGLALAIAITVFTGTGAADARSPRPWCVMEGGSAPLCLYYTFEQCYETIKGVGGRCLENPVLLWGRRTNQPRPYNRRDGRSYY